MDKIQSEFFSASKPSLGLFDVGFQPKLFVKVPKSTKIKGELSEAFKIRKMLVLSELLSIYFYHLFICIKLQRVLKQQPFKSLKL